MKIGIIGAMQMEVDELKLSLSDTREEQCAGVNFICGKMNDVEVVAAVSGVGKVFAAICAQTMILRFGVDRIINIGVAGSLVKGLKVLDVALADKVCQHDMDTSPIGDPVGILSGINMIYLPSDEKMRILMEQCLAELNINYKTGAIASGDQFIASEEKKAWIYEHFEAIAA